MPLVSGRSPAREAALWAFGLHALAVLWVSLRWGGGVRGGLVFWMDFPFSLVYAGLPGRLFVVASLLVGGAFWAAVAGALTLAIGRVVRGR